MVGTVLLTEAGNRLVTWNEPATACEPALLYHTSHAMLCCVLCRRPLPPSCADAKATLAGDMAKGGWSGAYSKQIPNNIYPNGIASAVACKQGCVRLFAADRAQLLNTPQPFPTLRN
jgi:hypothetical protein